jgi:Uma2 family endonuclease
MVIEGTARQIAYPKYSGLRLSADDFMELPDDGHRYELINGVMLMTPPPSFEHSDLAAEVHAQLIEYVRPRRLGKLFSEPGLRLGPDRVYQPDIAFYATGRTAGTKKLLAIAPDLVVEFLSPRTRAKDLNTKREDYEQFGVQEYWAIGRDEAWKFVLRDGKYAAEEVKGDRIVSEVIAGFTLDLKAARNGIAREEDFGDQEP